jgi:long-chain fatty acid transport protein
MRLHRLTFCLVLLGLCGPTPLGAQTNLETNAGVQFNFSTPGAGNMGLGGAFLGLAFDASAAYTNPAGLTLIAAPEALVESRHWRYTHVFTDHGRIEGEAPIGQAPDTISGLRDGEAENQVTGLSFFSYVHPFRRWSFALYRHELVNFEANFSTFGAYLERTRGRNPLGIPGTLDGRLAALRNRMKVDVVAYGAAAACRLEHGFSLGVAISSFDFAIDSTADRFLPDLLAEPDFRSDPLVNFQTQQGDDRDWGVNAGILWESPEKKWSVGGVYRQGPDFTFRAQSRRGPGALVELPEADQPAFFHVPDVYGLGIGFRPTDALRLALDYDRVRYSQLTQGFVDIFDLEALSREEPELDKFRIDDADEIHFGLEYAFLQRWPVLTLRGGVWSDPDHSLRFEGDNVGFRAVFRPRGDQMHYTAGVGFALRRLQVDAAVDYSHRVSVIALSAGFRL